MNISVTPIDGINEKLKRAHENIVNLEKEIATFYSIEFFNKGDNPIPSNKDLDVIMERVKNLESVSVPLRFSVLAGEILHHLRSTLDHMAWLLAKPEIKREKPTRVEFPICCERFNKEGAPSLKGKIEIFATDETQSILKRIQPYQGGNALNDSLWLIHDLDRKAKHRELPLTFTGFNMGSDRLNAIGNFYAENPLAILSPNAARQFHEQMNLTPIVLFAEFSQGKPEPMIPALHTFKGEVWFVLNELLGELSKCGHSQ